MKATFHKKPGRLRSVIGIAEFFAQAMSLIVLAVFCVQFCGNRYEVTGRSMEPDLTDGAVVLVDEAIYQVVRPNRFDVVLYEGDYGGTSVKRVLGLPGETIRIYDGKVEIDGNLLDVSDYLEDLNVAGIASEPHRIQENEYFLIGDWSEGSEDSRSSQIGDIHIDQMLGKVWFCISPKEKLGFVKN